MDDSTKTTEQRELWDGYLKKDISFLSCPAIENSFFRSLYEDGLLLARDLAGCDVLEIGCGDGTDAVKLVEDIGCATVIAIDLSPKRVDLAANLISELELKGKVEFQVGDAHDINFPENSFDALVCNSVLLFLDHERFFREAKRVLKPGGRVYFFNESMPHSPMANLARIVRLGPHQGDLEKNISRRISESRIQELSARHDIGYAYRVHFSFPMNLVWGFTLVVWRIAKRLGYSSEYKKPDPGFPALVARFDRRLLNNFSFFRKRAWICVGCFLFDEGSGDRARLGTEGLRSFSALNGSRTQHSS